MAAIAPNNADIKIAPPLDRKSIRKDTYLLRKQLGKDKESYFDVIGFLELVLPLIDPEFHLEPVSNEHLKGKLAETFPAEKKILVRESVYTSAVRGDGLARMTLAHELGHYYYHDASTVSYAQFAPGERLPALFNPEVQANIFAAELLAPINLIKGKSEWVVAKEFGVSQGAAKIQLSNAKKFENEKHRKSFKKKKRPNKKFDR